MGLAGLITRKLQNLDLIYIRGSSLAVGFLSFKVIAKKTIVKVPAISEDETSSGLISNISLSLVSVLDRSALFSAARIGVNGKSIYNELVLRRRLMHKRKPLEIPPGVNLKLIKKINDQTEKVSQGAINIAFIGSLQWWQGVDILVEAIGQLSSKISAIRLVIIGDGSCRQLIEERCKSLHINYEITGYLPHEKALKCLSNMDIFVLSSRKMTTRESIIPIKIMEAWALGIPTIVTKHQVFISEKIRDLVDVVYCEPEPSSVENAITRVIADSEMRQRLIINGKELAKRFDYNKTAENLLACLTEK